MATVSADLRRPSFDEAEELRAFHQGFDRELRTLVNSVPVNPSATIVDVGCGDGFYARLFAERLNERGRVVGIDIDPVLLESAAGYLRRSSPPCQTRFLAGSVGQLPLRGAADVAWCAQSLYSLPDPQQALRQLRDVLRPGGLAVVLENDTLHQLLLPWPAPLEIALRAAEMVALSEESRRPQKYYIGRQLPALLTKLGFDYVGFRMQCISRQAPLDDNLLAFLESYLSRLEARVAPILSPVDRKELAALIDRDNERWLLGRADLTLSWFNVLAWGRRPCSSL